MVLRILNYGKLVERKIQGAAYDEQLESLLHLSLIYDVMNSKTNP